VKEPSPRLAALRRRIDVLDRRVVRLLAARLRIVRAIKPLKSRLRDPRREAKILRGVVREARHRGADPVFVAAVYRALLGASRSFLRRRV